MCGNSESEGIYNKEIKRDEGINKNIGGGVGGRGRCMVLRWIQKKKEQN